MNYLEEAFALERDQWPNGETVWLKKGTFPNFGIGHARQGIYVASVGYAQEVRLCCTRRTNSPTERPAHVVLWSLNMHRTGWVRNPQAEHAYERFMRVNRITIQYIEGKR